MTIEYNKIEYWEKNLTLTLLFFNALIRYQLLKIN